MAAAPRAPRPLAFKPDLADAARRWDAFYAGDLIDRPPVCVTAPMPGMKPGPGTTYRERAHAEPDALIDRTLQIAEATFWGGEAVPCWYPGFGPDEIAAFCGGRLEHDPDSGDTSWSVPFVDDWDRDLPLRLRTDDPLWRRMLGLYRRAAERMAGKMLLSPPDLHTNMDLLSAARGPERVAQKRSPRARDPPVAQEAGLRAEADERADRDAQRQNNADNENRRKYPLSVRL
jgi:hypothetical protein